MMLDWHAMMLDWQAMMLRQVEELACNDAQAQMLILLSCQKISLKRNVLKNEIKRKETGNETFAVCSGESQPIFTTPCLQSLLNFAPFDEKSSRLGKMRRFGSWVKG